MDGLLDVLFPRGCAGCPQLIGGRAPFCEECQPFVETLPGEHCLSCAEPGLFRGQRCPRCELRPPPFSRAEAVFVHGGKVARAIHRFKYEDHPELAVPLGGLMAEGLSALWEPGFVLAALPLHRRRFWKRGFDQASLLAVELSKRSGLPLLPGALERTKPTRRQVGLDDAAREANVAHAFTAGTSVAGARVLLVDDVFTTGATCRSAALALRQAGAADVRVLTLARAWTG